VLCFDSDVILIFDIAFNVSEPRLMSQFEKVRQVVCVLISVLLQSEGWKCQYSSSYVVAAIT